MKRKAIALLLACTMALSLAACGGGASSSGTTEAKTEAKTDAATEAKSEAAATEAKADDTQAADAETKEASAGGTTEITWWAFPTFTQENAGDAFGSYEQKIIDAFEEANPDIKVKLETIDFTSGPEKIVTAIEGGTICDVLFDAPGRIIDYGKSGKLAELNDMFTDDFVKDV